MDHYKKQQAITPQTRPNHKFNRRRFLAAGASSLILESLSCCPKLGSHREVSTRPARFFFMSQGRTGLMNSDGTGLRYLDLRIPNQETWQPGDCFSDGRRVLMLSMEARRDGPGRPFSEYYTQTPTHIWIYDLDSGALDEIATRERMAVFYTPQLLLNDNRILVQVVRKNIGQIFSMNLNGTDAREFTRATDGFPYGLSLSPDGRRVAYHISAAAGYEIWTCDADGGNRVRVATKPGHIYFGPAWSPEGQLLTYQDCDASRDPGHDWSDVCVSRADGSQLRMLTVGQSMWFGASYGNPQNRGGGSNLVTWTCDGSILFPRRLPRSKVAWEYQSQRPDTDHFNRDFKPELASGGTEIWRVNPQDGFGKPLTHSEPPVWDFRTSQSPDGRHIVFCRAATGGAPAIWVMNSDGSNPRELTKGQDDRGADHPRWLSDGSRK